MTHQATAHPRAFVNRSAALATILISFGAATAAGAPADPDGAAATQRGRGRELSTPAGDTIYRFNSRTPEGAAGHFTLYYTITGTSQVDGPTVDTPGFIALPPGGGSGCERVGGGGPSTYALSNGPDYVETYACYLEYALRALAQLGFNGGEHPKEVGRVFIAQYDASGTAIPLNIPLLSGDVLLGNDVSEGRMATLVTHELFHQYQYTYTTHLVPWWLLEGGATWAEDLAFDDDNDYARHVNHYQADPAMGLKEASYDAVGFWRYLSEQVGPQHPAAQVSVRFMDELLKQLAAGAGEDAVDQTLATFGVDVTMAEIFVGDYALALAVFDRQLGEPALTFDEGAEAAYEQVAVVGGGTLAEVSVEASSLPEWGLHHRRYTARPGGGQVLVSVEADAQVTLQVAVVSAAGALSFRQLDTGLSPRARVDLDLGSELWVIVGTTDDAASYTLTADPR